MWTQINPWNSQYWSVFSPTMWEGEKMKESRDARIRIYGVSTKCVHKIPVEETTIKIYLQADHVAEDDLEPSVLLTWHMQSGHGKEYMESFGLLISNPLESLWDRIFSMCRLKLFQLWKRGNTKKNQCLFLFNDEHSKQPNMSSPCQFFLQSFSFSTTCNAGSKSNSQMLTVKQYDEFILDFQIIKEHC